MNSIIFCRGYNMQLAKKSLKTIISSCKDSPYQVNGTNPREYSVQTIEDGSCGLYENTQDTPTEVLLRMQGIVTDMNLVPNLHNNRKIAHIHQSITLTGLGEEEFEDQLKSLLELYACFTATIPDGQLQPWLPSYIDTGTSRINSFKLSNPLVMHPKKAVAARDLKELQISREMDPSNSLRREKGKWIYTEDNEVQIWHILTVDGQRRFTKAPLGQVRDGDIVEVQFCLRIEQYGNKGVKQLRAVLKAVAILDPSIQQAATRAKIQAQYLGTPIEASNSSKPFTTKRPRSGYDTEDAHEREVKRVTKATEHMQIDPEHGM